MEPYSVSVSRICAGLAAATSIPAFLAASDVMAAPLALATSARASAGIPTALGPVGALAQPPAMLSRRTGNNLRVTFMAIPAR